MKRIIISGAGGFLGSQIVEKISLSDSLEVLAITSKPKKYRDCRNVPTILTDYFLRGSFQFNEDNVFINCLFPMYANKEDLEAGAEISNQVIKVAKDYNIKSFINISSQRVYGPEREHPAKETDSVSPQTAYAKAKVDNEILCDSVFDAIPHANIRLSSLLGVGYSKQLVNRMVLLALENKRIEIKGGMQRYSFLDVRDAADALLIMGLSDPKLWQPVYNLGNNSSYSLSEIALVIKNSLSSKGINITIVTNSGDDTSSSELDASLFMHDFDWTPVYSLEQSINDIIDYQLVETHE